jgi:hypothetical protein
VAAFQKTAAVTDHHELMPVSICSRAMRSSWIDGQPAVDWMQKLITNVKSASRLQGLIAGKSYAFRARIRSKAANEYTDWCNSATFTPI